VELKLAEKIGQGRENVTRDIGSGKRSESTRSFQAIFADILGLPQDGLSAEQRGIVHDAESQIIAYSDKTDYETREDIAAKAVAEFNDAEWAHTEFDLDDIVLCHAPTGARLLPYLSEVGLSADVQLVQV
jgi:hypothetical protein